MHMVPSSELCWSNSTPAVAAGVAGAELRLAGGTQHSPTSQTICAARGSKTAGVGLVTDTDDTEQRRRQTT